MPADLVRVASAATASSSPARVAIVGSGAIAAVLAHHLTLAGDDVTFVVRDPTSPNAQQPRAIHRLRALARRVTTALQDLPLARTVPPDAREVWLCTATNALTGSWLMDLLAGLSPGTRVVSWLPGAGIADAIRDHLPPDIDLAQGEVSFLSFQAPLPTAPTPTGGIAYWTLGLGAALDCSRTGRAAARRLRRGGLPAIALPGFGVAASALATTTTVAVAVLETERWDRDVFRRRSQRTLAARAIRQALQSYAAHGSRRPGPGGERLSAAVLWTLPRLPQRAVPFDLDAYLQFHFSKVGEQTRQLLRRSAEQAALGGTRPAELDLVIRRLSAIDDARRPAAQRRRSVSRTPTA